jgi:2-oxo-4-hydroxy-4-carboxy-5-ureidoimidazoline decarboxylase
MDLAIWNSIPESQAFENLKACCHCQLWCQDMLKHRPFSNVDAVLKQSEKSWAALGEAEWLEAFSGHPKIGDLASLKTRFASTSHLASQEQGSVSQADAAILAQLAEGNAAYETRFGFIFIVCATGKTASEMLDLLKKRLSNSREDELKTAAAEQLKITKLRLQKLFT